MKRTNKSNREGTIKGKKLERIMDKKEKEETNIKTENIRFIKAKVKEAQIKFRKKIQRKTLLLKNQKKLKINEI